MIKLQEKEVFGLLERSYDENVCAILFQMRVFFLKKSNSRGSVASLISDEYVSIWCNMRCFWIGFRCTNNSPATES